MTVISKGTAVKADALRGDGPDCIVPRGGGQKRSQRATGELLPRRTEWRRPAKQGTTALRRWTAGSVPDLRKRPGGGPTSVTAGSGPTKFLAESRSSDRSILPGQREMVRTGGLRIRHVERDGHTKGHIAGDGTSLTRSRSAETCCVPASREGKPDSDDPLTIETKASWGVEASSPADRREPAGSRRDIGLHRAPQVGR